MPENQRSAKACERCRITKRRCRPPYPCQACVRQGQSCVVRDKARPHRVPRETNPSKPQKQKSLAVVRDSISPESVQSSHWDNSSDSQLLLEVEGKPARDPVGIVVHLVRIASKKRHNYDFNCCLIEPRSSRLKSARSNSPLQANPTSVLSELGHQKIKQIIRSIEQLKNTAIDLVDFSQVQSSINSVFMDNPMDTTLQDIDFEKTTARLDDLALAFATLTFGGFMENNADVSLAFLELSMKAAEGYVGQPTLNLALAIFLQHVCVLRIGTSNRSRALIAQAIQAAHDIGINRRGRSNSPLQTARLYLVLYFMDQYCAMTYNTAPCIRPTDYDLVIFDPLRQAAPELNNLVELVALNGKVLDKLHNCPLIYENVVSLESIIGKVCSTIGQPIPNKPHNEECFESRYLNLAHIHMFWSRIMLRAPFLLSNKHWMSSLSICVRAAQMLLSIYFNILGPAIQVIARVDSLAPDRKWEYAFKEVNQLPPTWRQVRRITTSVLIILYAFWHGEVSDYEAGRACAYALALLEFQRTRWGAALNDSRRSILYLAVINGIDIKEHLEGILSGANESFIANMLDVDHITAQADPTGEQQADGGESSVLQDWHGDGFGDMLTFTNLFPDAFPITEWDFYSPPNANLGEMENL